MDVLILTPLEIEYQAIRSFLSNLRTEKKNGAYYELGEYEGLHQVFLIGIRQSGSKNAEIALATERAIHHFHPNVLILTGIAGGVKDVMIGDVVVGTKAYGYESGKETDGGTVVRPDVLPYNERLLEIARHVARTDTWRKTFTNQRLTPKVVFGPIASGDKVIASTKSSIYKLLKQHYNDTTALEMEAIGFAKAAASYPHIATLNIRGISDLLDHKTEGDLAGNQELAIRHAAAFVFSMISNLDYTKINRQQMNNKELLQETSKHINAVLLHKHAGAHTSEVLKSLSLEVWDKVANLFVSETAELKTNLQDEDLLDDVQGAIKFKLRKHLKTDTTLRNELLSILTKLRSESVIDQFIRPKNSKNLIISSTINAGRDVNLGDKKVGQQIVNQGAIKNQINIRKNKGDLNFD